MLNDTKQTSVSGKFISFQAIKPVGGYARVREAWPVQYPTYSYLPSKELLPLPRGQYSQQLIDTDK